MATTPARRRALAAAVTATVVAIPAVTAIVDSTAAGAARGGRYAIAKAVATTAAAAQPGVTTTTPADVHFVAAADAGGGNTTVKRVVIPKTAAAGDTAVLFLASTSTSTWSAPSGVTGWTSAGMYMPSKLRTAVWTKTLTAADLGATVQFKANGYTHAAASVLVYSGLDASAPVRTLSRSSDAFTATHVTPKATASAGDWVVSYWADRAATPQTYTTPGSVGVRVKSPDTGTALTVQSVLADSKAAVTAGTYGGLTATTGQRTNQATAWSIVLRAATVTTTAPTSSSPTTPSSSTPAPSPSTSTSTPAPSPSTSTSTPAPSPSTSTSTTTGNAKCIADPQGIPAAGSGGLVGATASGTQSQAGLESQSGALKIYRDYYVSSQVDYAVRRSATDLAAGRLPWISFKLPYHWADMAAGKGDAWATDLVQKLAKLNGPIWLTFHHEPENDTATDGTMQDWKAMEQHLATIVHKNSHNIAFTVVLMAWNTLYGPTEDRLADIYPGSQYVDILGFDLYNEYGAKAGHAQLDFNKYFTAIQSFTSTHGNVPWAIGEVGYTYAAAQNYPRFLQDYYSSLLSHGGIGMAYFDSSYNSIADWTLDDSLRMGAFKEVLSKSLPLC